jgi:two-component system nitrogen regulation sensor histidine kinase GlnL
MKEEFHSAVVDGLTTSILLLSRQYEVIYMNQSAEELFGVSYRRVEGMPVSSMLHIDNDEVLTRMQENLDRGQTWTEHECTLSLIGGKEITVDCTVSPIEIDDTENVLIEMVTIDRQLKIARDSHLLKEHQATRSMLRGLAHEIKNPLGGLRGAAQLLESELEDKELTEYTGIIINEADRLHNLVDRMLGPNFVPNKSRQNIHEVLHYVYSLVTVEENNKVKFGVDFDPSIPEINFDRDLLVQALLNITNNALKAINRDGEILFKSRILRSYTIDSHLHKLVACISIIDNGPGVDEDIAPKIFFPMVSGESDGTGLGLAISQMLINQHGGLIEFESAPGRTEFRVLLPIDIGSEADSN